MEAMTIMGMAASQARFLGLTARKSNVEYQGQQINQQRTSLSNESANLYNQMLELTVPTPPSTNDFYTTVYTLDDSTEDYATGDYRLNNPVKTYNAENQYRVTLTHDVETRLGKTSSYTVQPNSEDKEGHRLLNFSNKGYISSIKYLPDDLNPYKVKTTVVTPEVKSYTLKDDLQAGVYKLSSEEIKKAEEKPEGYDGFYNGLKSEEAQKSVIANGCYFTIDDQGNYTWSTVAPDGTNEEDIQSAYDVAVAKEAETKTSYTLEVANEQVYDLTADQITGDGYPMPTGFEEWLECIGETAAADVKANGCSFYKNKKGEIIFISNNDLDKLKNGDTKDTVYLGSTYTYSTEYSTEVIAILEKSSNGRFSSIAVSNDPSYPATIQNRTFNISAKQEFDENGYKDAYNDYEYEKTKYEKSISDINAQTEVIQNEDQQLELRLQQLNTEQDAISTEMDSVSKVIEDNVEKTFKVFA